MSTRGIIARPTEGGSWEGRYHHFDGYPEGLGRTLWAAYHGYFRGNAFAMLRYLIDEHPAGWSSINDSDFAVPPGFNEAHDRPPRGIAWGSAAWNAWREAYRQTERGRRPICYCHGDRSEPDHGYVTPDVDWGCDYCYVIDPIEKTLTVLQPMRYIIAYPNGKPGPLGSAGWEQLWTGSLDGPEPVWAHIGAQEDESASTTSG